MTFKRKRPSGEYYHCTTCHRDLVEGQYKKQPIGFEKQEDKLVPSTTRFGVFCIDCSMFLCYVDLEPASHILKAPRIQKDPKRPNPTIKS